MKITPTTQEGYKLLHDGVVELSVVEANGIRVDVEYLERAIKKTDEQIVLMRDELRRDETGRRWQKMFGAKTNLGSRDQLVDVLFRSKLKGGLGLTPRGMTESGNRISAKGDDLDLLGVPFVDKFLELERMKMANGTFLKGIRRETGADGIMHPFFHLHIPVTFRGSSEAPNFQNQPTRNEKMGRIVRRCVIARDGCVLVENDYKGNEVNIASCYCKDPVLIEYISDPTKDMHRDMAMEIFVLRKSEVSKPIRQSAKNQFVFPEFYNDWYLSCAQMMWDEIRRRDLRGPNNVSLYEHLRDKGIKKLGDVEKDEDGHYADPAPGTFVRHVQKIERDFWDNRFSAYKQWKQEFYDAYLDRGWFDLYTGFRVEGVFERNDVTNWPMQGSAFHCLLWPLIRIGRELRRQQLRSLLIGQIHDSLVGDVRIDELDAYLEIVHRYSEREIRKVYPWIILPTIVETEIVPQGFTWYEKRKVEFTPGHGCKADGYEGSATGLIKYWNDHQEIITQAKK